MTRHGNIFALLFGIADERQKEMIFSNVIYNQDIPGITTPYFKFYELEAMCQSGNLKEVKEEILSYWGGMLKRGAVTFWEEYDPSQPKEEQYSMYQDPYGKSLCHAWAGSPIYLIGRYFMGIRPLKAGYERFLAEPECRMFEEADCRVPIKGGEIRIEWKGGLLKAVTDKEGGELRVNGKRYPLTPKEEIQIRYKEDK